MTEATDLMDICETVSDEASFIEFLEHLRSDFLDSRDKEARKPSSPYTADANGWENTTIDAFLEASVAWANDTQDSTINPWEKAAKIILAGKVYE